MTPFQIYCAPTAIIILILERVYGGRRTLNRVTPLAPLFLRLMILLTVAYSIVGFIRRLGALGLFVLAALDSSFLFLPFGNDIALISAVSGDPRLSVAALDVSMTVAGSIVGVLIIDVTMRKLGEKGLEHFVKPKKIERLKAKLEKNAWWTLFLASLLPPPFPFTVIVLVAATLQTPRTRLLAAILVGRLIRFSLLALLALRFGERILAVLNSDILEYSMYALAAVSLVGSALSIYKWLHAKKGKPKGALKREPNSPTLNAP